MAERSLDINPNIRKAQQNVDRFEASKKSLVPEFELPKDEESERRYSEETLMADFITERIESKEARELINDPILIKTAYQDFLSNARQGKEGGTIDAAWALHTSSAFLMTETLHLLAPEEEKELRAYLDDPILIKDAYQDFLSHAKEGKEGDTGNAARALQTSSALLATNTLRLLAPEEEKELQAYLNDPIFIKTAYQRFLSYVRQGKEGDIGNAALALWTSSALTTVRNYLREKGKKIDDTNAANEALKFKKTIPPRPETRAF